jgi:hypothetical protein
MNKPRLPTDIDFLLESVMAETPDKVTFFKSDVARLKAAGKNDLKVGSLPWKRVDTLAFFVHVDKKVIPYSPDRHEELEDRLRYAAKEAHIAPNDFNQKYTSYTDDTGNISFAELGGKNPIGLYGLENKYDNPGVAVRTYLRENIQYFRNFSIRGIRDEVPGGGKVPRADVPAGRVWIKKKIMSFWNDRKEIVPHMKLLTGFLDSLKIDKTMCVYEFLDTRGFFTYRELFKQETDNEKLSPEDVSALQKIQHIDPRAKKKLASPEYQDAMLKKAGKGFDAAVKAGAMMPALEETIKLKNLLDKPQ